MCPRMTIVIIVITTTQAGLLTHMLRLLKNTPEMRLPIQI